MRPPLAESLDLEAHPEGGWYRRTWTARERAHLSDGRDRAAASAILFHLPAGEASAWHRVSSDELWVAHVGRVEVELGGSGPAPDGVTTVAVLGVDIAVGDTPQVLVPAGTWQRTRPGDADALVTCVVSPEFHFDDFELFPRTENGARMTEATPPEPADGRVRTPERQGDVLAIQELAIAYGYAVDDRDWRRWEALFTPHAHIDYLHSGGIVGTPAELAEWMPDALGLFAWSLHSVLTHEIRFTGPETATGRVHLFNRNGLEWNGRPELFDVGGRYLDEYRRIGDTWRFSGRVEETLYVTGGEFAAIVRDLAARTAPDRPPPIG